MTFGERLTELRKERGFSNRNDFANYIGMPSTTLRNYETDVREPGHIFLKQMADIFHVSVDYLLCITDDKTPPIKHSNYSVCEIEHIKKYRVLDEHGKKMVDFTLSEEYKRCEALHEKAAATEQNAVRLINYYYRLASAGSGQILFDTPPTKRIEIPNTSDYARVDYAVGVNGKSMEPTYCDGDTLLIEMAEEINMGENGIFLVDGECYVKKLGEKELISLNSDYKNIPLNETARCMGRVIGKL